EIRNKAGNPNKEKGKSSLCTFPRFLLCRLREVRHAPRSGWPQKGAKSHKNEQDWKIRNTKSESRNKAGKPNKEMGKSSLCTDTRFLLCRLREELHPPRSCWPQDGTKSHKKKQDWTIRNPKSEIRNKAGNPNKEKGKSSLCTFPRFLLCRLR